jgi:hypothetical protein
MGLVRFAILTVLLLMMLALPLGMLLQWILQIRHVVAMPEYSFNL